jgi:hypothetical protein
MSTFENTVLVQICTKLYKQRTSIGVLVFAPICDRKQNSGQRRKVMAVLCG